MILWCIWSVVACLVLLDGNCWWLPSDLPTASSLSAEWRSAELLSHQTLLEMAPEMSVSKLWVLSQLVLTFTKSKWQNKSSRSRHKWIPSVCWRWHHCCFLYSYSRASFQLLLWCCTRLQHTAIMLILFTSTVFHLFCSWRSFLALSMAYSNNTWWGVHRMNCFSSFCRHSFWLLLTIIIRHVPGST